MKEIVIPGDDPEADRLISSYCFRSRDERFGPKYRKNVSVMLKKVCETFMLDPHLVADSVAGDMSVVGNGQIAVTREECMWVNRLQTEQPAACAGYIHYHRYRESYFHYKILIFNTESAVEACQKLRKYFDPITAGSKGTAGGIALPDLGDLEDRVGLTKFMEG